MKLFWEAWDLNCVKRNTVVQIVIATLAFIMIVRIWPCSLVQNHTYSKQKAVRFDKERFTSNDKKLQTVYFSDTHIYRIRLYMDCAAGQGEAETVLFRLYNDEFSCIYEEEADSRSIEKEEQLTATPDMDVEPGKVYYYEILVPEESSVDYFLPVASRSNLGQQENSTLYIDGIINDEVSLVADFDYSRPLTAVRIIAYDILIVFFALLAYYFLNRMMALYDQRFAESNEVIQEYFRIGISAVAVLAAICLIFFSVVLNKFGGELWDRLFFLIGTVTALAWLLLAVWRPKLLSRKKKKTQIPAPKKISLIWRNYIQTVCFGLLFYALCEYVNADREFYHSTNTRWMLIFLAIALLMNYEEKLFVNWLSAVWLAVGTVGSVVYCNTVRADENGLLLARLICGVVLTWGLLVLNIIYGCVFNGKIHKIQFRRVQAEIMRNKQQAALAVLWIIFSIMMYVSRFEKTWVFTATLPFVALFFAKSTPAAIGRMLRNFCNGIFLSFGLSTLFCLLHRPHHYWMLYRYNGMFHTVACTGMYLVVVFGAAMAKLYGKLKDRKNMLLLCLPEYFVTASAAGFILLTMSKTALLTAFVTVLAVMALTVAAYRKSGKRIIAELGVLAVVCAVSFPMVFTSLRIIPAVVNDPVRYDLEFQDRSFMIYKGDPVDSDKYMTVKRFFETLFGRFYREEAETEARLTTQEGGAVAYVGTKPLGLDVGKRYEEENETADEPKTEKKDISNGRFAIYMDYIDALELQGHPRMGPLEKPGVEYAHAHNSYLQVAYNFGIVAGVIFLILYALSLWRSVKLFMQYRDRYNIYLVPFAMIVVFGFISITEWAFHPCIPAGFSFLLVQPLLISAKSSSGEGQEEL